MTDALLFEVVRQKFALPLSAAREVFRAVQPARAPLAPFGCLGIVDIRGVALPLLDLGVLLGLRRPGSSASREHEFVDSHMLLVRVDEDRVLLLVDRVLEVGVSASEQLQRQRPLALLGRSAGLVAGEAHVGELRALLLDPARLLNARRLGLLRRLVGPRGEARAP